MSQIGIYLNGQLLKTYDDPLEALEDAIDFHDQTGKFHEVKCVDRHEESVNE